MSITRRRKALNIHPLNALAERVTTLRGGGGLNRSSDGIEDLTSDALYYCTDQEVEEFRSLEEITERNLSVTYFLSYGEDAVVLAQASYKCGEGVHPVGLKTCNNISLKILDCHVELCSPRNDKIFSHLNSSTPKLINQSDNRRMEGIACSL